MKTIRILSSKHWPIELILNRWKGGLRINARLSGHKDIAVLETSHNRPYFYWMESIKPSEILMAGYVWAPYIPLYSTEPVKFSGFLYHVKRIKRKIANWCDNAFRRIGL